MRGGFRGGLRGNPRGGRGRQSFYGPPETIKELGKFTHSCEGFMVCEATCDDVPLANRPVFNKDKVKIGKIDEIFGPIHSYGFSVKLEDGVKAESFEPGFKVYIDPYSLKPITFFEPKPRVNKDANGQKKGPGIIRGPNAIAKRGNYRGAPRGFGRSTFRGSSRGSRGAPRGSTRGV